MLKLKNVSKFYYSKGLIATGFTKVNLELNRGEFVAITGESGSGKSTLINVLSGLDSYEEGEMYIDGSETSHYISKDWENYRRKNIGNIYQSFNLINSYTVYQNVELVLILNGLNKIDIKKRVNDLIEEVGLSKFKNTKVSKLSGGQKQRVAIARALAKDTPVIIADEPTGSLDKKSAIGIVKLLSSIAKDKLVIVVTHNFEQVEEFATRKIVMHDGRIIEDQKLKKSEIIKNFETNEYKDISIFNKIKLGIRNTFNVIPKFILLLIVFSFIVAALMSEYSSFKKEEAVAEEDGYNYVFQDTSINRIVINKKDRNSFSKDEIESIKNMNNISYVLENDTLADEFVQITDPEMEFWLSGTASSISLFKGSVDVGRVPESDQEIVISGTKNDYQLGTDYKDLMDKEFCFVDNDTGDVDKSKTYKVVGIKYTDNDDYTYKLYFSDSVLDLLKEQLHSSYSKIVVNFMNSNHESTSYENAWKVVSNEYVSEGEVFIPEDYKYLCEKENCLEKELSINVSNLYYKDSKVLHVKKYYNQKNFNYVLLINNYNKDEFSDKYNGIIYINPNDYKSLFNKDTYQMSVYVKNIKNIKDTDKLLEKSGYNTLVIKDTLVKSGYSIFLNVLKTILTIILVIVLFFISYFIIKIILKSRNSYFSIIRMLGGSKKTIRSLLIIELFIISTIAFIIFSLIAYINSIGIIDVSFIDTVNKYMTNRDYIILFIIITGMSYLLSLKYSTQLFKNSAMNTFREEI